MKTQTEYYLSQFDTSGADADRNLPYWGRSYGDNWLWGAREWVAAEVEYHAEWAMSEGQAREVCDINPQFDVGGQANAYLFDQRYKVLNARASFDLRRARRKVDLEIFDHDYLVYDWEREGSSEPRRIDYDFTMSDHDEISEGVEYCQEFLIVAVPVVLCAELAGRVGFAFELNARVDEEQNGECNPEAEVKLSGRPFASVDALGSGGVGVSGLGGGIYASVNLLELQVPTQVNASLRMLGDASNVEINVSADSKLTLASLKGEIGGYVEFPRICVPFTNKCIGGRVSKEFFKWKRAISAEFDLFEFDWSIDLNAWALICDIPEVDCEG